MKSGVNSVSIESSEATSLDIWIYMEWDRDRKWKDKRWKWKKASAASGAPEGWKKTEKKDENAY